MRLRVGCVCGGWNSGPMTDTWRETPYWDDPAEWAIDDDPWCEGCQRGGFKHSPGCPAVGDEENRDEFYGNQSDSAGA